MSYRLRIGARIGKRILVVLYSLAASSALAYALTYLPPIAGGPLRG